MSTPANVLERPTAQQRLRLLDALPQPNITTVTQWNMVGTVASSLPVHAFATSISQPLVTTSVAVEVAYKPILTIRDSSLAVGVTAELEVTGDQFILADTATGIFGVGSTPSNVVADFLSALRDHADVLAAQQALSPALQRQLVYLQRHLAQ